ncbi:DUF7673 family protein, partial [Shewanella algae]|uniref:DUF7673 family protein n=2 Tax=Pseudomonadota TaxID=1224 RepID=UPI00313E4E50
MTIMDGAYRRSVQRARGSDVQAGICQTFLFLVYSLDAFGAWSPQTIGRLDAGLQDDVLAIIQHLRTTPWRPNGGAVKSL